MRRKQPDYTYDRKTIGTLAAMQVLIPDQVIDNFFHYDINRIIFPVLGMGEKEGKKFRVMISQKNKDNPQGIPLIVKHA
jgi:hypothetical protein